MFVDKVKLQLVAGKGGNGIVAWRREKYLPKGGPYGGNGGKGGDIILLADPQTPSLESFRYRRKIKGENGQAGGPVCRQGRNGKNIVLKVPCGTLVKDPETGEILYDFTDKGEKVVLCRGGKGGKGNAFFKSPTNRAPTKCTPGKEGYERNVELELKLIADVGLVGFPNAGKSTLISQVTEVKVKMAPYPFTTLRPNLGYAYGESGKRTLIADIPGIIAGAHQNRGLGFSFLRHIERTSLLLFVLDASGIDGRDPTTDFTVLRQELALYNEALAKKPFLVALNKVDTPEAREHCLHFVKNYSYPKETLFEISALTGEGVEALLKALHAATL